MAKARAPAKSDEIYREDFYAWTRQESELLRAGRFTELDLPHLIEEVEDLGANLRKAVISRTREIMLHLLKLQHSPAAEPRRGWHENVGRQRDDLELDLTPRLRREMAAELENSYRRARRRAADELARDRVAPDDLPPTCPYTIEQILDPDWLPDNVHGLKD